MVTEFFTVRERLSSSLRKALSSIGIDSLANPVRYGQIQALQGALRSMSSNPYQPLPSPASAVFPASMNLDGREIHASFVFDCPYYMEAITRFRQIHTWRRVTHGLVFASGVVLLLIALMVLVIAGEWLTGVSLALLALLSLFWRTIERWKIGRSLRRSPEAGDVFRVTINEQGYHIQSKMHDAKMAWGAFTYAKDFPDGVLLLQGNMCRWIPYRSLHDPADETVLYPFVVSRILSSRPPR
jgi:hypothetical protein